MEKTNFTVARVVTHTRAGVGKCERHNERKNENYGNMNVELERTPMNVHFKACGELTYNETLDRLVADGAVSLRGLKENAKVYDEMILDVNTDYFERHGGYKFAREFYEEAYRFACKLYGKQNILSTVMHADEINLALTEKYGYPVYHYHLHIVALPVVEKQVLWSKRRKDKALVGTVKETVQQVSHSKKWTSQRRWMVRASPPLTIRADPSTSHRTAFCRTNFAAICGRGASPILSVGSAVARRIICPTCNTKSTKTRNAWKQYRRKSGQRKPSMRSSIPSTRPMPRLTKWGRKR